MLLIWFVVIVFNPRRACARVAAVAVSVCLSVCLSVCVCPLSHISPLGLLFVVKTLPRTQRATKVKKFVAFSLKMLRSSATSFDGRTSGRPSENTHAHCGYVSSRQDRSRCEAPYAIAISSPCILALQKSLQGWRSLARVVCLPGYPLPRDIFWTVVPCPAI